MGSADFGSADFASPDFGSVDFAAGVALASAAGLADSPCWANAGRANSTSAITKLVRVILNNVIHNQRLTQKDHDLTALLRTFS
jgi:hypothetical protein